jgi:pimeloyl-ACP methyl ester carboxylesterase
MLPGMAQLAFDDKGTGNAVLFIHGHPFNRTMWNPQIAALAPWYRKIVPDLRGYGASFDISRYSITLEEFAADLASLLDELHVEKACVVGLSMGGQIAMEFSRAYPERVAGLILAATFARAETPEGVEFRHRTADYIVEHGMALHGCDLLPKLISGNSMRKRPEVASFVYNMIAATDPHNAAAALRGRAERRDYTPSLSKIDAPTLIVVGTEDAFTTVEEARQLHELIPQAQLEVFDGIGHLPNLEDPDRFNSTLRAFLERVYSPSVVS